RVFHVTGVETCALPICPPRPGGAIQRRLDGNVGRRHRGLIGGPALPCTHHPIVTQTALRSTRAPRRRWLSIRSTCGRPLDQRREVGRAACREGSQGRGL